MWNTKKIDIIKKSFNIVIFDSFLSEKELIFKYGPMLLFLEAMKKYQTETIEAFQKNNNILKIKQLADITGNVYFPFNSEYTPALEYSKEFKKAYIEEIKNKY